ncbi:MAG: diguanylate cyclase [Planctomycetes bacterium]|nr:diguanylate cyclase [Planctomycetota bacterium]
MPDRDPVESFSSEAGLFSYAQILHLLKIEFSRARRYSYPLTCAIFQIDRLENLKDLYGYKVRDQIEEKVVATVHQLSRSSDFLGKMGERMVLILPHTEAEGVRVLMNRVRERLRDLSFEVDERPVQVSLSAGIATYKDRNTLFFDSVIKNAESALGEVIQRGGNGVAVFAAEER